MKDRKAFNELLLKAKRNVDEENFDEAIAASFRACRKSEIPSDIQKILQDPKTKNLYPDVPACRFLSVDVEFLAHGSLCS
jgi:hypothetical protein